MIWSKWFSTWHGVVKDYDQATDELSIIFAGVPYLLFTMTDEEQDQETYKIKLAEIRSAKQGKYAILKQDQAANAGVWYI